MRIQPAKGMQVTAHAIRNARINNPIIIGGGRLKITIGTPPEQLLINGLIGMWPKPTDVPQPSSGHRAISFTLDFHGIKIPVMNLEWCCADFRGRLFHDGGRQDGLGITVLFISRVPPIFQLEYRRPNQKPPESIAEDGIRLKFCLWCGRSLLEHYKSGLPPFRSESSE